MFGTVLRDVYRADERSDMRAAIDELCSPSDNILWASTGLYAYFNPEHDRKGEAGQHLLYVGLARDLADRFAAHNGLQGTSVRGNKSTEIAKWFDTHEYLGISLLPQSPFAQINTHRERSELRKLKSGRARPMPNNPPDGQRSIEALEGQIIESYRQRFRRRPKWNRIGGDAGGQRQAATGSARGILRLIDGSWDSLLCARLPIRALCNSATNGFFESEALHLARTYAILSEDGATDRSIRHALTWLRSSPMFGPIIMDQIDRIDASDYLRLASDPENFDILSWVVDSKN